MTALGSSSTSPASRICLNHRGSKPTYAATEAIARGGAVGHVRLARGDVIIFSISRDAVEDSPLPKARPGKSTEAALGVE
ncbi:hypothetical protein IFM12275_14780 [Nocardia sputorum]|nr:hypothetical protein IFM12275_14780 [Nocardia sputorum]